jgi:ABC-2 type transport system ATP-binding protein
MIEVKNVSKIFRVHKKEPGLYNSIKSLFVRKWIENVALDNVSITVNEGEIVGLVGANGAGKTTLVKILSGIIHPDRGKVRVLGFNPWERKNAFRKQIALIMGQKAQLWWDLPAGDCFLLLREIYQIPVDKFKKNLDFLTETLGVNKQMNIQIRRLSLGERMKMELIATMLHNPKVVFLDEPTIGLDLTAQRAIRQFILDYRQKYRPAMILTSHYMEDIEKLCKRIVIIKKGSIVYDGQLDDIVHHFSEYKVVAATLSDGENINDFVMPKELGSVIAREKGAIRVKAERDKLAEAATYLLNSLPVNDITIQEEDISNIIEKLIREDK